MEENRAVLIAGPGKCGASLLMQIFTELGMETGYGRDHVKKVKKLSKDVGGNYEWRCRGKQMKFPLPYIIKEPQMCTDIDLRIEKLKLKVDHIYILTRRPGPVANALEFLRRESSVDVKRFDRRLSTDSLDSLERGISLRIQTLIHLVAELEIPHTLVSFPKWGHDYRYGHRKFRFLLNKYGITRTQWKKAVRDNVDDDLIAKAYADFPDWNRSYMREKYGFGGMR